MAQGSRWEKRESEGAGRSAWRCSIVRSGQNCRGFPGLQRECLTFRARTADVPHQSLVWSQGLETRSWPCRQQARPGPPHTALSEVTAEKEARAGLPVPKEQPLYSVRPCGT